MNILSKTLTKTSKSNIFLPSIPIYLHPFSASSPYSTKLSKNESQTQALSPKKSKNLERPSEILFQPKVANWLSLIGTVKIPVESCTAIDGKSWAGTIISQEGRSGSTYKNIPWYIIDFTYYPCSNLFLFCYFFCGFISDVINWINMMFYVSIVVLNFVCSWFT